MIPFNQDPGFEFPRGAEIKPFPTTCEGKAEAEMNKQYELPPAAKTRLTRLKQVFFEVRPRYTPGSPAMVSLDEALRTAGDEIDAAARALTGLYGEQYQKRVEDLGMEGIVFARWGGWPVLTRLDLITLKETTVDTRRR